MAWSRGPQFPTEPMVASVARVVLRGAEVPVAYATFSDRSSVRRGAVENTPARSIPTSLRRHRVEGAGGRRKLAVHASRPVFGLPRCWSGSGTCWSTPQPLRWCGFGRTDVGTSDSRLPTKERTSFGLSPTVFRGLRNRKRSLLPNGHGCRRGRSLRTARSSLLVQAAWSR
jgi:hypothetical protein